MDYETFKQYFEADIREKLEEKGYENVKINFDTIEKTNQKYEAMSVVPEGSNVGVNFNIENSYAILMIQTIMPVFSPVQQCSLQKGLKMYLHLI